MLQFQAQGYFAWIVLNDKDKIVRYSPTYSPNLILDQGLDGIAVRSWADSFVTCAVGTGTNAPANSQTGMQNETQRVATYLDLQSANTSSLSGNEFTIQRTFVFPKEGANVVYNEAGFGYSLTGPNNLFSRIRLPSVQVSSGERIVIQYQLVVKVLPILPKILTKPIIDKRTIGVSRGSLQFQRVGLKGVNGAGQSYNFDDAEGCNEPSTSAKAFLSINSSTPAVFPNSIDRSGTTFEKSVSLSTYIPGTFTRNKIFTALKKEGVNLSWRSAGLGATSGNSFSKTGLVYVFNAPYPKDVGQLDLAYTFSWNRRFVFPGTTLHYWQDEEHLSSRRNQLLSYYGMSDE